MPHRSLRVLVVDDNDDSAQSMALWLRFRGHDVAVARDGAEALTEADRYQPEAVVLDLGLPGLDGVEVARRLRAGPTGPALRLIALTGRLEREDNAGNDFDAWFVKPVTPMEIAEALQG